MSRYDDYDRRDRPSRYGGGGEDRRENRGRYDDVGHASLPVLLSAAALRRAIQQ
jgi:hypothetical protein